MSERILVLNPGSTSTKVGYFHGPDPVFTEEVSHPREEIVRFDGAASQLEYRADAVRAVLAGRTEFQGTLDCVAGRGGILQSLPGGVYRVSPEMVEILLAAKYGDHPCNLGAPLAALFAAEYGVPAFITDPPVTDEMRDVAKYTGLPAIRRRSVFHALNQRAAAREAARRIGTTYELGAFIVAHMGGGISIGAHFKGRVVDVVNALDGEGPMSPERTGRLPLLQALRLMEQGRPLEDVKRDILTRGGLFAHLGTTDFREARRRAESGDSLARDVLDAMAYAISREIAAMIPALMLDGPAKVDAVVLTGGLAKSRWLVREITRLAGFKSPVVVVPGEMELAALAAGAVRGLHGEAREYPVEPQRAFCPVSAPCLRGSDGAPEREPSLALWEFS